MARQRRRICRRCHTLTLNAWFCDVCSHFYEVAGGSLEERKDRKALLDAQEALEGWEETVDKLTAKLEAAQPRLAKYKRAVTDAHEDYMEHDDLDRPKNVPDMKQIRPPTE